jgi:thiol:disulfide interchange protein
MAVYFYTDWCGYCKRLDRDVLATAEVEQHLSRLVRVRINPEDGPQEEAIARRYGITGYPSFFVLAPGSPAPVRINHYKRQGSGWVPMTPGDFVIAVREAEG